MEAGFGEIDIRKIAVPKDYIAELRFFYATTDQHTVREQTGLHIYIFCLDLKYPLVFERIFRHVFSVI